MKSTLIKLAVLVMSISLAACSTNTQKENTTIGAVTGAVGGGLVGSLFGGGTGKVVAIGVGAIAGGLLGGYAGHNMQHADSNNMNSTLNNQPSGKTKTWTNKKTGAHYSMTPGQKVVVSGYSNCRQYQTIVTNSGKQQVINGTACRMKNGAWQTVASNQ
jgi:surface antigen